MAIETAAQDLQDQILTEQVDPVQLEQTVRDTNLAEPAKVELVQQIRAADQVARDKPIPYRTAQSPVSPLASQQGSFFSDSSLQNFFDSKVISSSPTVPDKRAAQLGFAVAVASGAAPEDLSSVATEVRTDLGATGHSVLLEQFLMDTRQDDEAAVFSGHWENQSFLGFAVQEPAQANTLLDEAKEELRTLHAVNKEARMISEAVDRLTPEQKKIFKNFEFVMSEVMYQQAVEQTFSRQIAENSENASLWDWTTATLNPLFAVSSRSDQGKLLQILGERIGADPQNYVFKSDDADAVVKYLMDPTLKVSELSARLREVQEVVAHMDTEQLGVNPVWSSELFDVIQDDLMNLDQNVSMGNILDTVDAVGTAPVVGSVLGIGKRLRGAGEALGARLFGQLGAASKARTPESIAELETVLRKTVDNALGLTTQVPEATPVVVSAETKALQARKAELELRAGSAGTRLDRKTLEQDKRQLNAELESIKQQNLTDRTKEIQGTGVKFKAANKQAAKEQSARIAEKEAELDLIQARIDEEDQFQAAKAEISRIDQKLQVASPVLAQKSKLALGVQAAITDRGSVFDALSAQNPVVLRSIVSAAVKEDVKALDFLGVTPEAVAERVVPNPNSGLGVTSSVVTGSPHKIDRLVLKFNEELAKQSVSDVLTKQEIQDVPQKWAQTVAAQSAGTLHPSHSSLVQVAEDGTLDVLGVFGGSVDGGYVNLTDAERASQYLFGLEGKIKVRVQGSNKPLEYWEDVKDTITKSNGKLEFFIEAKNTLTPNSSFANPFTANYISPSIPGASYLQSWSRMLREDLFNGYTAYVDKGTRLAGMQQQMLEPVLRMRGSDADTWTKVLMHGDEHEIVFSSAAEASRVLGVPVNDRVWDAYKGTRAYYDSVAAVRQRAVYKNLDQNGFKSAYDANGVLKDLNGQVHVRPLADKPARGARPEDGTDGLFTSDKVWGDEIYDLETGTVQKLTDEFIDSVYSSGDKIIVRVHREAEFLDGELFDFAVIKTGKVKPLSKTPMNIRNGHVDVNYKGEDWWAPLVGGHKGGTSYKVTKISEKRVNGVKVPRDSTVGLYANRAQAVAAREALIQKDIDDLFGIATPEDARALAEQTYPSPLLTREGEREFGLDTAGTFSGLPAHARKRGERVLGPNGTAEVLSIEESLSKSVGEIRRALSIDAVEVQKRRFGQLYAKHADKYESFPVEFDQIVWSETAKAAGIPAEARRAHAMIQNFDHAVSNKEFVLFMNHVETYASELIDNGSKVFGPLLKGISRSQLDKELKKVTATLLIGTRVLYQVMANTAQTAFLFVQNPVQFSVNTIRRTLATALFGIPNLNIDARVMNVVGAKLFGATPEQFAKHVQNLKESGILRSAAAQDMVALLGESGRVEAGRHNITSGAFWKRMVPGFGGGERIGKALMFPQHIATDIANLFAWNHAFSTAAAKDGIDGALSRAGRVTVAADTRRLMWNQNRTDQFAYQQNAASMQLMFVQHVHRMYNDLIVDPAVRTFTGNKLGISMDGTNPYARTWAESVKTMFMMTGLFGAGVYPLFDELKDEIGDVLTDKGLSKEAVSYFLDGVVAKGVEDAVGERMNVQSRFSPEGALKTTVEMMFTNDGGFQLGGPVASLWGTGKKLTRMGEAYWNAEPMDQAVWMKLIQATAASVTSGTNDVFRAYAAANIGEYVDSSGRPIAEVTDTSWIPILFSVPPESVQSYYDTRSQTFDAEKQMLEVAKVANRMATSMVAGVQDGQVNGELVLSALTQGMRAIELLSGSNVIQAQEAKRVFATQLVFESDGVLMKHADKIASTLSTDQAKQALKKLQNDNPELKDGIQFLLDALDYQQ
jgi:hypothetical protein